MSPRAPIQGCLRVGIKGQGQVQRKNSGGGDRGGWGRGGALGAGNRRILRALRIPRSPLRSQVDPGMDASSVNGRIKACCAEETRDEVQVDANVAQRSLVKSLIRLGVPTKIHGDDIIADIGLAQAALQV